MEWIMHEMSSSIANIYSRTKGKAEGACALGVLNMKNDTPLWATLGPWIKAWRGV